MDASETPQMRVPQFYSAGEELANTITHGLGMLLSFFGLTAIIYNALYYGDVRHIVVCSIFGGSLVILYSASTIYHGSRNPKVKYIFRVIDHSAVYLFFTGCFTPFGIIHLWEDWGKWLCFGIWGLTLIGIFFKIFFFERFSFLVFMTFFLMGSLSVLAACLLLVSIPSREMILLVVGGLSYLIGVLFYIWNRMPYNHAIWHVFVLGGSACHYFAIMNSLFALQPVIV